MTKTAVQYDLFGEIEAAEHSAEDAAGERRLARAEWAARFERPDWVAPHDTQGGMRKGDSKPGWRCPDPECREIEPNGFSLTINHGWDPETPGHEPFDGRCHKVRRRARTQTTTTVTEGHP